MSNFMNSIPPLRIKRCKFDLSYNHKTDMDMGQLIPIGNWNCLPNDKIRIGNQAVIRMQPLMAPLLHRIKVKVEAFFVPYRLLWDNWEEFITGGPDGTSAPSIPLWDDYYEDAIAPPKGSLWDFFARNTLAINSSLKDPDKEFVPNAFLRRAYNLIYNEYYINRNVQTEVDLDNNDILFRNWKNDYFASALPFQQRGDMAAISMSFDNSPVVFGDPIDLGTTSPIEGQYNFADVLNSTYQGVDVATRLSSDSWAMARHQENSESDLSGYVGTPYGHLIHNSFPLDGKYRYIPLEADNSSNAGTFDAATLRMMLQTQKFLERNARIGSRYMEQLLGRWHVFAGDARLQRPEFIYSTTNIIQVEDIPQTSATVEGGTAQGHLAGKGTGAQVNQGSVYTCKEHGCIIQMLSLVPDLDYIPQGFDRETLVKNRLQFYNPEFAHLSEQMIKKGELYFSGNKANDNDMFGYIPIWSEYRHRRNVVSNNMRDTFDYWHLARKFASQPSLNDDFLKIDGTTSTMKRIFESGTTIPGFIVAFGNFFTALRPIPKYGTPGLMDHF